MTKKITWMMVMRLRKGLTQQQVADAIGVTQPRVSLWESGQSDIPPLRRRQIADILGTDPEHLHREAV